MMHTWMSVCIDGGLVMYASLLKQHIPVHGEPPLWNQEAVAERHNALRLWPVEKCAMKTVSRTHCL